MKRDTKINISLVAMFAGIFYWMFSGHEIITASPEYEALISQYRGGGLFSIGSIVIALTFFAAYFYPPIIWMLLCLEVVDRGSINEILFNRESWYLWLAPVAILLLISILIVLRIVTSLAAHVFFIGGPLYLVFCWASDALKNDRKTS